MTVSSLRSTAFIRTRPGTIRANTLVWHVQPEAAAVLGTGPLPIDNWIESGRAELVKANDQRTVFRMALPTGTVYLKRCRVHRPRAWLREWVRPPKAKLEFDHALALRARGIATIEPLAWAKQAGRGPGESWLVTKAVEAVPFSQWVERRLLPATRHHLARLLAAFIARLHDAGVLHPDLHPGNLLVETGPTGEPRLVLIDLHAAKPGPPASRHSAVHNLVLFNRWFRMRASRTDRLRFWLAYRAARSTTPRLDRSLAKNIEKQTDRSNARFWAKRLGRYVSNNREYHRISGPSARGMAVHSLPPEFVTAFLEDPDAVFRTTASITLKDSRTSTVIETAVAGEHGPASVIVKRFNRKSWGTVWKNTVRSSPALRSWLTGHSLRDRGLPTPRPLLLAHRYRFGVPVVSYLVVEKVPGAVELSAAVDGITDRQMIRALASELGRLVRILHDRHVSHRDLKAPNILLEDGRSPTLIDLVGVRAGPAVPFAVRVRDLARLNASFLQTTAVTRTGRLRALMAYLGVPPQDGKGWKVWWAAVARATTEKVAKNARTGRPLA